MFYLNFVIYVTTNLIIGLLANMFLTLKSKRMTKVMNAGLWFLILFIPSLIKYNLPIEAPYYDLLYYLAIILYFVLGIVFYTEKLWVKILFILYLLTIQSVSELLIFGMCGLLGKEIVVDFNTVETGCFVIATNIITIAIMSLSNIVYRFFRRKHMQAMHGMWPIIFLPISTFLIMEKIELFDRVNMRIPIHEALIYLLVLLIDIALLATIVYQYEKKEQKDMLDTIAKKMKESEAQVIKLEQDYDRLAKVKHDKRNEITVLARLIEAGEEDSAREYCEKILNKN